MCVFQGTGLTELIAFSQRLRATVASGQSEIKLGSCLGSDLTVYQPCLKYSGLSSMGAPKTLSVGGRGTGIIVFISPKLTTHSLSIIPGVLLEISP